jgi:hypothetical protein
MRVKTTMVTGPCGISRLRRRRPRRIRASAYLTGPIFAILICSAPAAACNGDTGTLGAFERNAALPGYTFNVDVAMAMRHFPWLHFHVQGVGKYEPGKSYVIHFTKLPWFAPQQAHDTDLSMLDPAMWPSRFLYQEAGRDSGNTLYDLRAIDDPTLKSATVALGPKFCTRKVDAAYADGTEIKMNVTFSQIGAFMLPTTLRADIQQSHLLLSANAEFKDYAFSSEGARPDLAGEPPRAKGSTTSTREDGLEKKVMFPPSASIISRPRPRSELGSRKTGRVIP